MFVCEQHPANERNILTLILIRVKEIISSGFAKYVVDPDKTLSYDIVQNYVNDHIPKVSQPLVSNWKDTLVDIPEKFNYTHMYEYLMKRTVKVLAVDGKVMDTCDLPVADKPLTKGYNFYGSGHITEVKVNVTNGYCHVWCHVLASMKDQSYLTQVCLGATSGIILTSQCKCVAGKGGKCNHVAAVLFALVEFRASQTTDSCTANPQQWHLPSRKSKKQTRPQKTGERDVKRHIFGRQGQVRKLPLDGFNDFMPIADPVVDTDALKKGLTDVHHDMCLHQMLQTTSDSSECDTERETSMTPQEIIQSELQVPDEVTLLEQRTLGQSSNVEWWRAKKGRITASICKDCTGKGKPEIQVKKIIAVGDPKRKPRSDHMRYGIDNEDTACDMFVKQLQLSNVPVNIRKCGLFISNAHGELAASPDRVGEIAGEKVVVEIKCLSASRTLSPKDAICQKQKDSNFAFRWQDDKCVVKERHKYYYQVQMQMAMTGFNTAYFVVFTNKDVPVTWSKLVFDKEFWSEKEEILLNFHAQHVVPALVAQRFNVP